MLPRAASICFAGERGNIFRFLTWGLKTMRLIGLKTVLKLSLAVLLPALTVSGQGVRVELGKQINRIPKGCESVVPASVDGQIDMRALLSEVQCKGAGDMLTEYSYTLTSNRRIKNKNGEV